MLHLQLELCSAASRATASSQTMSKKLSTESSGAGVSEEMAIMWDRRGTCVEERGRLTLLEVSESPPLYPFWVNASFVGLRSMMPARGGQKMNSGPLVHLSQGLTDETDVDY